MLFHLLNIVGRLNDFRKGDLSKTLARVVNPQQTPTKEGGQPSTNTDQSGAAAGQFLPF
jgi:hypothetical protein